MKHFILSIFLAFATLTQGQPLLSAFFAETEVDTFNYLLDIYPNASAAYSLRSLKSNYTGGLVQIRRSSDNETNTFYADSNNTLSLFSKDISNTRLSTWVGSNDGFVTIWYDQSGSGVNVGNSTQSKQPQIINSGVINTLNYKSSIYFDGDKTLTKAGFLGSNANTLLILMNQTNVSGKSITTDGVDIGIRNTASNQFKIKGTNGSGSALIIVDSANNRGQILLQAYGVNPIATYADLKVGGSGNIAGYSDGNLTIGGGNNNMIGNIQEVVFYNVDNISNRLGIYTNFNDYYSIYGKDLYITATGGDSVYTDGDYKVHKFTTSGNFNVSETGLQPIDGNTIDYLVIAGGAGGGALTTGGGSGGGGAGGLLQGSTSIVANNYPISIGAGGAVNQDGNNTTFHTFTSIAGGRGGVINDGFDGGSGGGAGGYTTQNYGGLGTVGQGNDGGDNSGVYGASGGGAGGEGVIGRGGFGLFSLISGGFQFYAAGGGNGASPFWGGAPAAGGSGIGGYGAPSLPVSIRNGIENTGSGGGGGSGYNNSVQGGSGGSGITIVRYKFQQSTYITATGGDMDTVGDYITHTFNSSDDFVVTSLGDETTYGNIIDYMIVAGGGGGGSGNGGVGGGGGGAGGLLEGTNQTVSVSSYAIEIGAGGDGGTAGTRGLNGDASLINTIATATGGGGGGTYLNRSGISGGSGGGGSYNSGAGGAGISGQGFAGAIGSAGTGVPYAGGGGGGAGAVGRTGDNTSRGGLGKPIYFSGSTVYYAGGGGGGRNSGTAATGGSSGGGTGSTSGILATSGTANTGGGGGGGRGTNDLAGSGGSGVVKIRYRYK